MRAGADYNARARGQRARRAATTRARAQPSRRGAHARAHGHGHARTTRVCCMGAAAVFGGAAGGGVRLRGCRVLQQRLEPLRRRHPPRWVNACVRARGPAGARVR